MIEIWLNDAVVMKKPHACGTNDWRVIRVGADIGIECLNCHRKLMMPRQEFLKKVKKLTHTPNSKQTFGNIINRLEQ